MLPITFNWNLMECGSSTIFKKVNHMNDILSLMPIEVANLLNIIFSPLLAIDPNPQNPAFSILIIAFLVSLISNLAVKYLQNSEKISEIRQELDKHNRRLKDFRHSKHNNSASENRLLANINPLMAQHRFGNLRRPCGNTFCCRMVFMVYDLFIQFQSDTEKFFGHKTKLI